MLKIRIPRVDLKIFLLVFPFLEPWWFTRNGIIDGIYDLTKLCICAYVIFLLYEKQVRKSPFVIIYVIYRIYICTVTVVRGIYDIGYISESIQYVCYVLLLNYLIHEYGIEVVKCLTIGILLLLILNVLTYTSGGIIFEPSSGYYLLGIRTRVAEVAIPAMGMSIYYNKSTSKGNKIKWLIFIASITFFVLEWVATALTCTTLFFVLLFVEKFIFNKFKGMYHVLLLVVCILISLGVVFFNIQEQFADLIQLLLHKQATLTGRTDLWYIAIAKVKQNWLFGYGFENKGNFVSMYDFTTTSHNQWLQTMFYGGVIGCFLYYILPILSIKKAISIKFLNYRENAILVITMFVIIIMSTTEICMDNIYYLSFILLMYNCKELKNATE